VRKRDRKKKTNKQTRKNNNSATTTTTDQPNNKLIKMQITENKHSSLRPPLYLIEVVVEAP
jgi:hypothetical protein